MLESLSCPGCFTRYGLRPERVHPGIRRARCFRCGEEFSAVEAVQRLLAPPPAMDLANFSPTGTLEGINPEDLLELDAALSAPPTHDLPPAAALADDSALTLGDLEGTEDEILEKTLVIEPTPESAPAEAGDGASFSSAKDAIAKLLGDSPATPAASAAERRGGRGNTMDVEATLDALENTLGGTPAHSLKGNALTAEPTQTLGSTVRLSPAELQAAMSAGAGAPPPSQAPTVAIPIPSPASTRPAFAPQAEMAAPVTGDPNLLKIQVGQETYQNVTLDQLTAWIEQGRVQDWHMVSRQFSDNWIEAGKVPSLRPVFERVRRMGQSNPAATPAAQPAFETAPVKKGLFGWMAGRN